MPGFNTVRAVQRGLDVLQLVNRHGGVRIQELARMAKLPRPTTYRLLETLKNSGFVALDPATDGWFPTLMSKSLSSGFRDETWVAQLAMPRMMALVRQILWPSSLMTFSNYVMIVRESTHTQSPFPLDGGMIGRGIPLLLTAGGRAYLAFCPDVERAAILERLRASNRPEHELARRPAELEKLLQQARTRGFAVRMIGWRSSMASISAPVFHKGRVLACLTVIWAKSALAEEDAVKQFAARLQETCGKISGDLLSQ